VGPEHALLHDLERVRYADCRDDEAVAAFRLLAETEGIIPALESSHALGFVVREADSLRGKVVLLNLSGRGDKDLGILEQMGAFDEKTQGERS
jgi:tryptophan synthase beta chain